MGIIVSQPTKNFESASVSSDAEGKQHGTGTPAMFLYRAITRGCIKLLRVNLLGTYGKFATLFAATIVISLYLFLSLRISKLSKLKDLGDARYVELNAELARLPAIPSEPSDSWKLPRVRDTSILSAYLETRPEVVLEEDSNLQRPEKGHAWAMIRIIGIIPVKLEKSRLVCYYRYRYASGKGSRILARKSTAIRLSAFQENFGMFYCAAHILCELPGLEDSEDRLDLPYEVTIASESVRDPIADLTDREFVVVRYPREGWPLRNFHSNSTSNDQTMAVCVQPFHHRFDRDLELVAFVEFYRMMGVDRFTFYRDSVSPKVGKILDYYAREGVAIVIEWKLPQIYIYERNLRVDGIFAALNDCLYRNTYHSEHRYVVGVDVDEYIVPRKHNDFREMMKHLNPEGTEIGAWIFRNVFFYLMHPDDPETLKSGSPRLQLHAKTTRWRETNPPWDRSKYIVQGRDILDLGNHRVWTMKKTWSVFSTRYQEVAVDPLVAASHHYRKCETKVEKCWRRPTEIDRTAHRFTVRLASRVSFVTEQVFRQEAITGGFWREASEGVLP